MSLRLIVEQAPHRQAEMERVYTGGTLVIGRSDDADWKLNDPDMFISRRHAIISDQDGRVLVTDASSGGLFIDNAANAVGAGNAAPLEPGMRLRMGDFVIRVEDVASEARPDVPDPSVRRGGMSFGFDFGAAPEKEEKRERPASLPDPFGTRRDQQPPPVLEDRVPPRPLDQDDPFRLDLRRGADPAQSRQEAKPDPVRERGDYFAGPTPREMAREERPMPTGDSDRARVRDPFGASGGGDGKGKFGGDPFGTENPAPEPTDARREGGGKAPREPPRDPFGHVGEPPEPDRTADEDRSAFSAEALFGSESGAEASPSTGPRPRDEIPPEPPEPPAEAKPASPAPPNALTADAEELRKALFRGLGLDPARHPTGDPVAEMEMIGTQFRGLVEGVMLLLRTRAQEKSRARVAQTLISNADVNPLKFLVTTDEAVAALVGPDRPGYLAPKDAVAWAFRDLTDHQLRTWTALQTSLRRMIDRFDPSEIEHEMENTGMLERLMAGGRSAKLWQLYVERYSEIAEAAEAQFLGEMGPEFREAYEKKGGS